jgi:fatty acid desaturase
MNANKENDYLKDLFTRLPEEPLPTDFRVRLMQQIQEEAVWIKKRNERLSWIILILASLAMLTLGILAVIYLGIPKFSFEISTEAIQTFPFYLYIAFLVFLLLFADHYFRKKYREKQKGE